MLVRGIFELPHECRAIRLELEVPAPALLQMRPLLLDITAGRG